MNELKPCPFCGEPPMLIASKYRHDETSYYVKCMNKQCGVIPVTYECCDMEYVIESWNRRAYDGKE